TPPEAPGNANRPAPFGTGRLLRRELPLGQLLAALHVLVGPLGGAVSRVQGVDQVHAGDRQGRATHGDGAEDATDAGERDDGRDGRDATDDGEAFDQADGRSDDATGDDAERG